MRIIGGDLKGKKLIAVTGRTTRPTSDRVREAIFDIISHHIRGAVVLDLFAGTGALGMEALSRGAQAAVFVDNNPGALSVVKRNLQACKLSGRAKVIRWDILRNLRCLQSIQLSFSLSGLALSPAQANIRRQDMAGPPVFDLVLLDPPYHRNAVASTLRGLDESRRVVPGALVVVEHGPQDAFADSLRTFKLEDERRYGQTRVSFLRYVNF